MENVMRDSSEIVEEAVEQDLNEFAIHSIQERLGKLEAKEEKQKASIDTARKVVAEGITLNMPMINNLRADKETEEIGKEAFPNALYILDRGRIQAFKEGRIYPIIGWVKSSSGGEYVMKAINQSDYPKGIGCNCVGCIMNSSREKNRTCKHNKAFFEKVVIV